MRNSSMPSSVVKRFEYEAEKQILRIVYVSGNVYDYKNVPLKVYHALKNSTSKGTFLNREIKGKYDYKKVTID